MKEFFHGWRRKAGVVTLVGALAFMVLWIRGIVVTEMFCTGTGNGLMYHSLVLGRNGIRWERNQSDGELGWMEGWTSHMPSWPNDPLHGYTVPTVIEWRLQFGGFDFGRFHEQEYTASVVEWWAIPYWSTVIPLTLLSAYLILWKARKRDTVHPI
jgi:hypothetical protein